MSDASKATIIVALLTLLGGLGTALIANSDKVFHIITILVTGEESPPSPPSQLSELNWYVIVASFEIADAAGQVKAETQLAAMNTAGFKDFRIVDSRDVAGFRNGYLTVVAGPFKKADANDLLVKVIPKFGGARLRDKTKPPSN